MGIAKSPSLIDDQHLSLKQISNIIPKDDPYYQEMLAQQRELEQKAKTRKGPSDSGKHIFNHPFLKQYHKDQAAKNRQKIEESNYLQNVQFLQKWSIYKQVKAICIKKKNFAEKKRDMVKLYLLMIKMRQYMSYSAVIYRQHLARVIKK